VEAAKVEATSAAGGATGAAPASAPKPSLSDVTALIGTMPCSILQASVNDRRVLVRGYVAGSKIIGRIERGLGNVAGVEEVKSEIRGVPAVFCQTLELYAPFWRANRDAGFGTGIGTPNGDNAFMGGDRLIVDLKTPTYKSWLYVDYFALDGSVVHMMPSPGEDFNEGDPRDSFQLGEPGDIGLWEVAPPFGNEMIVVLATSAPIFEDARGQLEEANDYRAALRKRLKVLESESGKAKISADFVVIKTEPKS
jgi:hypothetical protein